jgi:hypothetical protein
MQRGGGTLVYGGSDRWRGPGHNAILIDGTAWHLVYHAYDAEAGGTPTLRIEKLIWDDDGWPVSPSALACSETRCGLYRPSGVNRTTGISHASAAGHCIHRDQREASTEPISARSSMGRRNPGRSPANRADRRTAVP